MSLVHWEYFISLVDDLEHTGRYVEFSTKNFGTFSVEYSRIILAAGSEVDVIAKMLYPSGVKAPKRPNIDDHRRILSKEFPLLSSMEIEVPRYGFKYIPWDAWSTGQNPPWWNWYNEIKHHRNQYFAKANLGCALETVTGLAVMVWYLYAKDLAATNLELAPRFVMPAAKHLFSGILLPQNLFCPPDYLPPDELKNAPLRRKYEARSRQ